MQFSRTEETVNSLLHVWPAGSTNGNNICKHLLGQGMYSLQVLLACTSCNNTIARFCSCHMKNAVALVQSPTFGPTAEQCLECSGCHGPGMPAVRAPHYFLGASMWCAQSVMTVHPLSSASLASRWSGFTANAWPTWRVSNARMRACMLQCTKHM